MPGNNQAPDKDFENSFFQLAYDKLQEKLYNLLPFLVGFEIVNKSDDNTKALGVFGFKANNNQVMYVPAFFIDGSVKGLDIMYSKNNEQFYPLNEDFAELFLKDDATGLGQASKETRDKIQRDMTPTDMRQLTTPPRTGKVSYASVIDFVKESDNIVKKAFLNIFETNPDFAESVLRFYPLDKVAEAVAPVIEKEASVDSDPLRIVTPMNKVAGLTEPEQEKMLTEGYLLIDKRAAEEKSRVGIFKYTETFGNPTDNGFYSYVTESGGIRYGLIFNRPQQLRQHFHTESCIVVDLDSKNKGQAYIVKSTDVFVKDKYEIEDYSEVYKQFEDLSTVEPSFDKTYILVNEKLDATQAFRVRSNFKDDKGVRRVRVELDYDDPCCCSPSRRKWDNKFVKDEKVREYTLVPSKIDSRRIEIKGDTIYVPKSYKLFQIHTREYLREWATDAPYGTEAWDKAQGKRKKEEERIKQGRPGGVSALQGALSEYNIYPFTLRSNGSDYFASIPAVRKKYRNAALAKLGMVVHYGLDEKSASELVDSVLPGESKEGYIKLAYTGDYTPYLRDENPYTNELGQPTYQGQGYEETHNPGDGYRGDPTQLGKGVMPDIEGLDQNIDQANQLAQAGQKGIFDTQAIATLSKYVSPHNKVFQYMPSFVKAMDELGRLLFLVYWETEKFEDMYGRGELPELVELITNVFKNIGDLIIFLKRKSPELSINMVKDELSV